MNKNEALKAAIDGKKIIPKDWNWIGDYIYWNDYKFLFHHANGKEEEIQFVFNNNDWEIVPEYVDFFTAWQAYEEGYRIKHGLLIWCKKYEADDKYNSSIGIFSREQIRSKEWLIGKKVL
jgi:hypothetical protein